MLQHELLPHQQQDPKYRARYDEHGRIQLSSQQRSWVNSMLRKKMGDKKVALFLFTHGSTPLFAASSPLRSRNKFDEEWLQSMLDDALDWYASLLVSILAYDSLPGVAERRALEAKTKCPAQQKRRKRHIVSAQPLFR